MAGAGLRAGVTGHAAGRAWEPAAALGRWGAGGCVWPPGEAGTGPGLGAGSLSAWGQCCPACGPGRASQGPCAPTPPRAHLPRGLRTCWSRVGGEADGHGVQAQGPGLPCPEHLQPGPRSSVPGMSRPVWRGWLRPAERLQPLWLPGLGGQRPEEGPCSASVGPGALRAAGVPALLRVSSPPVCLAAEPAAPWGGESRGPTVGRGAGCEAADGAGSGPGEVPPSSTDVGGCEGRLAGWAGLPSLRGGGVWGWSRAEVAGS